MKDKPRFDILNGACAAVTDREGVYGSPKETYDRTALIFTAILKDKLKYDISPADVVLLMCGVKMARLINTPEHTDSQVDLAGYASLLSEVA